MVGQMHFVVYENMELGNESIVRDSKVTEKQVYSKFIRQVEVIPGIGVDLGMTFLCSLGLM